MKFIKDIVHKYPKGIIAITILITIFFAYQAADIQINTDIKKMFPEGDPVVDTFDRVSERYGGAEYVVLMLQDENIMDRESLGHIDEITTKMEEIEGVNKAQSITNIEEIRGQGFTVEVGDFIKDLPATGEEAKQLADKALTKERYLGTLISKDLKAATIIAQLKPDSDQQHVVSKVKEIRTEADLTEESYLTGNPVLTKTMADNMKSDILKLFPFVSVVVMGILFTSFRSLRGILLPIIVVLLSVIWTVGFVAWLGKTLSIVSTVLPVLLVSVGSAYAIHFLARFYEDQLEGLSKSEAITESILKVGIAIIMAGVTTIVGFSSLGLSELTIIKDFGLFTAVGVFVALVMSITFLPAVLELMRSPKRFQAAEKRPLLDRIFSLLFKTVKKHNSLVIIVVIVISTLSLWVAPQIQPETNYITFFQQNSEIRQANRLVNSKFGGSDSLEIIIDTEETDGIEDPEFLQKVDKLQAQLEELELLSNTMSVVDLLEEENQALNEGKEEYNRLPKRGIAQYLLLLSSDDDDLLEDYIDFDHREVRIRTMTANAGSKKTERTLTKVTELVNNQFSSDEYKVTITGIPVLRNTLTDMIVSSQIRSLLASIVFAFIITSILLKSPVKGFVCSFPIAVTVLLNFGLMGWTAIPLNVATSMIASIAVGVGVDYSIHCYTRYQEEREKGVSIMESLQVAIRTIGRANYFNATAVTAGFLVLLFSSFPPLRTFGLLTSITMVVSFLGAMVLLPSLVIVGQRITEALSGDDDVTLNN
ncbi:efflux RND transporter permease subunit [Acetohalobium arabaticum]|uniref:Efflux transporter, hydrophobe/amphiphile efflux-3 (HAE3) family n=1 Tax=Acetohalobium arabaticum (strain ATCC 49924 / DSM 5501 / Z-7288) TaxID=574087 RepID=D9QRQ8_ACEAZ|nr:hydrophobe/amphiphile efflux-3 (HAE3) family transporter [Acetohalobium arabaticum]ADL13199.1 efflux transporter, hydrophobe/amphiphile efflux-3 (HAE3) family [Acetohalobium arabaticum DSM 5501]